MMEILREREMNEVLELIEDAEKGELEELELVKSLGLLRDEALNSAVIKHLEENGVRIIFIDGE